MDDSKLSTKKEKNGSPNTGSEDIHLRHRDDIQHGKNIYYSIGGAHGEMVIVVGNGHGDSSSNPRRDWLHFT